MAGTITTSTIQTDSTSPPTFRNNSVEIGTLCRAWVNFNGTGTVAIRASFNVSSITDNGTGDYTVNFTNAMPDANYSPTMSVASVNMGIQPVVKSASTGGSPSTKTTSALQIVLQYAPTATNYDASEIYVAVFR